MCASQLNPLFGGPALEDILAYDLMLMDAPGAIRAEGRANWALQALRRIPGVDGPCELCSGFNEPRTFDCSTLEELIEDETTAAERFRSFCAVRGLDENEAKASPESAAEFLDLEWGVTLAAAKLPASEAEVVEVYAKLVAFALENQLRLWDPQAGAEIDLRTPGLRPPMWG